MSRVEHDLPSLKFGDQAVDAEGRRWVCVGWRQNTSGRFPVFVRELVNASAIGSPWPEALNYHAALTTTLLKKFPSLRDHPEEKLT